MKKILMLGGSAQQIIAIETAKRLGLYTVLCDFLPDNPGQYYADRFYLESTTDKEAVLRIAKEEKIDGILAYASDPAAPTAAYVAEALGLPTNPYKSVETLCNKDQFRLFLNSHGFNTPKGRAYNDKEEALSDLTYFSFPVIIKPVDSSGSKGVTVIRGEKDITNAIDFAFSFSRSHRIIIEDYIEKKHPYLIGGDIFISNGKIVQWGLMNCHRDSCVNPLVPVGKSYPPLLGEGDIEAIKNTLQKLVSELDIKFGPMNVELMIDKHNQVFLIDVGPRSGGNMIPDLLSIIFGCDVVEMSVRAAMGETLEIDASHSELYCATLNIHSQSEGVFKKIEIEPELNQYIIRKNIYKKPGDIIRCFSNASDAIGIVFFRFPDMNTMIEFENNMNKYVSIELE